MLKGKSLLDYTNLFSPNDYEKHDKKILRYFQQLKRWKNYIALFAVSKGNLKNLKYHTFSNKLFLLFAVSAKIKMEKYIKKNNQLRY